MLLRGECVGALAGVLIVAQSRFQIDAVHRHGDIVVMGNLSSHKGTAIRRALHVAGAKLFFLPPHSPDLNSIEQTFSKLKTLLRKAAERTVETTWKRTGTLLKEFSAMERANDVRNSGYVST